MTKKLLLLCGVLACFSVSAPRAVPGDSPFSPPAASRSIIGPFGGDIRGLAVNPADSREIYAASYNNGQVFKSVNSGAAWTYIASFDSRLYDIVSAPSDPNTIYALEEKGVFKSVDKGATWKECAFGAWRYSYGQAAVNPQNPEEVYVAGYYQTSPGDVYRTCPALFKSRNGGKTWTMTKFFSSSRSGSLTCLALCKNSPADLYVAGRSWGKQGAYYFICRSTNGGKTWKDVSPAMSGSPCAVAVDPVNPSRVFLAADKNVWRSSNGGASWATKILEPLTALAIDPVHPQALYAGGSGRIFRSLDGGLCWAETRVGGLAQDFLVCSGRVLAATSAGVLRSDTQGASWKASQEGLSAQNVTTLAVAPSSPQVLYAGTPSIGIHRSSNGGLSWLKRGASVACGSVVKIAVYPDNPDWLFASVVG